MARPTSEVRKITNRMARYRKYLSDGKALSGNDIARIKKMEDGWKERLDVEADKLLVLANGGDISAERALKRSGYSHLLSSS